MGNDKEGECHQISTASSDSTAQAFLSSIDEHPILGGLVDQTMEYDYERAEMLRKTGEVLTPQMWLFKLLLGPIDS